MLALTVASTHDRNLAHKLVFRRLGVSLQKAFVSKCDRMSDNRHRSDEGVGLLGVVLPGGGERLNVTVVAGESMDTGLNANEAELGVAILAELLKMLADADGLLDEVVEVLGNLGGEAGLLKNTEDLGAGDSLDLGDAVGVTEGDTDLGGGGALLGELDDLFNDVVGGDLDPAGGRLAVRQAAAGNTLAGGVHSSHFV